MSDRFPAKIYIGGSLPRTKLTELLRAADQDGAGLDWGEGTPSLAELKEAITGEKPLELVNDEARYGELSYVQEFCQKNNLTWRRHADAYAEYDGEISGMDPENDDMRTCLATQGEDPAVTLSTMRYLLKEGYTLEKLITYLEWFEPANVPALVLTDS